METLQTLRMTQENFKAIMEETERYKNVDFTEPLTRLLCSQLLNSINTLPEEQFQSMFYDVMADERPELYKEIKNTSKKNLSNKTQKIEPTYKIM